MTIGDQLKEHGVALVMPKKKRTSKSSIATGVESASPSVVVEELTPRPKFNFSGLKAAPKLVSGERLIPTAEQMRVMAEDLANFRRDVGPHMHDLIGQLWDVFLAPTELVPAFAEGKVFLEIEIRAILDSAEPFRTPGRIAWADAVIKTAPDPFQNRGILTAVIKRLEEEKFMVVGVGVGFKHNGQNYVLADDLRIRDDAQSVMKALQQLRERGAQTEQQEAKSELDQLRATAGQNLITFDEMMGGKDGFIIIDVPDQSTPAGKFFAGGTILVQSLAGSVRIINGAGRIRRRALNLNDTGVSIPVSRLLEEKPKFDNSSWRDQLGIHGLIRRFIDREEEKKRRVVQAETEKAEAIRRATKAKARFKEETDREFETLAGKADLGFDGFFAGNVGDFAFRLAMFNDSKTNRRVWQVMCLLRRARDGQVQMLECPDRLKDYFGDDVSKPMDPGKRFEGIPYPLGSLLRIGLSEFEKNEKRKKETTEVAVFETTPVVETVSV